MNIIVRSESIIVRGLYLLEHAIKGKTMKTRIDELIDGYRNKRIECTGLSKAEKALYTAIIDISIRNLKQIDQSTLTPAEALRASPKKYTAIWKHYKGGWCLSEIIPTKINRQGHVLEFCGNAVKVNLNIHYTGKPEDSLVTRSDLE